MTSLKECEVLPDELRNKVWDYQENVGEDEIKKKIEKKAKTEEIKAVALVKANPELVAAKIEEAKKNEKPKSSIVAPKKEEKASVKKLKDAKKQDLVSINTFMKRLADAMLRNFNPKYVDPNADATKPPTDIKTPKAPITLPAEFVNPPVTEKQPVKPKSKKRDSQQPVTCNCEGECEGVLEVGEYISEVLLKYIPLKTHTFTKVADAQKGKKKSGVDLNSFLKHNKVHKVESASSKTSGTKVQNFLGNLFGH